MKWILSLIAAGLVATVLPAQETLTVDPAHSHIEFSVAHMVVTRTRGEFEEFTATVKAQEGKLVSATAEIKVDSIDTDNEKRDEHLESGDFFDAEAFPTITFESTEVKDGKLVGNLTIRDVTKEVALDMEWLGPVKGPWGKTRYGLNLSGEIDRTEFGLTWNKALETGGMVVGETVKLDISIELTD